jgi:hypothetical protein
MKKESILISCDKNHEKEKKLLLFESGLSEFIDVPVIQTTAIDQNYLIRDTYNSFSYLYGLNNKLDIVISAVENFYKTIPSVFKIQRSNFIYSQIFPITKRSLSRGETS